MRSKAQQMGLKKDLRKKYKKRRLSISIQEKEEMDQGIFSFLKEMDWDAVHVLHSFLPIPTLKEPDTLRFIHWIWQQKKHIQIATPKINDRTLEHYLFSEDSEMLANTWNISEVKKGEQIHPLTIDAVLIPMLICDRQGQRVGYGKGFYDRFLAECRKDVQKIGISYFDPISKVEDTEATDIPLDLCVTPNKIWRFK